MLFELVLKNSDSLSNLSLKHIKQLFLDAEKESDEDEVDNQDDLEEEDEIDEDMKKDEDDKIKVPATPIKAKNRQPSAKDSESIDSEENYSEDYSEEPVDSEMQTKNVHDTNISETIDARNTPVV